MLEYYELLSNYKTIKKLLFTTHDRMFIIDFCDKI